MNISNSFRIFPLLLLLNLIVFIVGCEKNKDFTVPTSTQLFFKLQEGTSTEAIEILNYIKSQNTKWGFVENISSKVGFPIWNKSESYQESDRLQGKSTITMIPFKLPNERRINALLIVKVNEIDTIIRIVNAKNYSLYPFSEMDQGPKVTAQNIFHLFSYFENKVFGYNSFLIRDHRLLTNSNNYNIGEPSLYVLRLNSENLSSTLNSSSSHYFTYTFTHCYTLQELGVNTKQQEKTVNLVNNVLPHPSPGLICYETTVSVFIEDNFPFDPGGSPGDTEGGGGACEDCPPLWTDVCGEVNVGGNIVNLCSGSYGWDAETHYVLSEEDIEIWNEIESEDEEADLTNSMNCKGTGLFGGNASWNGTMEHWQIQLDYLTCNFAAEREYQIPFAGSSGFHPGYADLVNPLTQEIFEIKNNTPRQIELGSAEVQKYVLFANTHCPIPANGNSTPPQWRKGLSYSTKYFPSKDPLKLLKAQIAPNSPGVITYEYVQKNPAEPSPLPVVLPQSILDQFSELVTKLKESIDGYKEIIAEYLRTHPELVSYIKGAAFTVAIGIIVGTIIEDIFTGGAGILDDIASFKLAYNIVRFAMKL